MSGARGIEAAKAFVRISADDSQARGILSRLPSLFKSVATAIGAIGLGNLFAQGISKATAAVFSFAESGAAVDDMAKRTGASSESLSQLAFAAEQSGSSLQGVEKGMRKLSDVTTEAANGSDAAQKSLAAVGLTAGDLAGLKPEQAFLSIAEGLRQIHDPATRASAALDLFGRGGTELLPMMEDGAGGIQKLMAEADSLGLTLTGDQAAAAAAFDDSWQKVKATFLSTAKVIGTALAPAFTWVFQTASEAIPVMVALWQSIGSAIVQVASAAWAALQELGAGFKPLFDSYVQYLGGMKDLLVSGEWSKAANFMWTTLKYAWAVGIDALSQEWQIWKKAFVDTFSEALFAAQKLWAGFQNTIASGMLEVMAFFDATINVEGAQQTLQEDFNRRMDAAKKEAEAGNKQREVAFEASIGSASKDLVKAREEWQAALAEANAIGEKKANEPGAAAIADDRFTKLMESLKTGDIAARIEGVVKGPSAVGDLRTVQGASQITGLINATGVLSKQAVNLLQQIQSTEQKMLTIAQRGPVLVKV